MVALVSCLVSQGRFFFSGKVIMGMHSFIMSMFHNVFHNVQEPCLP